MNLKAYRKAIGDVWLPISGRRRFTSYEYEFTKQLFDSCEPLEIVLQAICACSERAKSTGAVLYSIGVIKGDIEAMKKKQAKTQVGAQVPAEDWRNSWILDLEILIKEETNPVFATLYRGLLSELPHLSKVEAQIRWGRIQAAMREMVK